MRMPPVTDTRETKLLTRMLAPEARVLPQELAHRIIAMRFPPADVARMNELAAKAQQGTLTADEQADIEFYDRMGDFVNILQAEARLSLKNAGLAP
jgi:DNA-binding FadR family transcriptional regulator